MIYSNSMPFTFGSKFEIFLVTFRIDFFPFPLSQAIDLSTRLPFQIKVRLSAHLIYFLHSSTVRETDLSF